MESMLGIFVWALGLCVGSFLNVVIYRLPRDLSVAEPRWSFCPTCQRTLSWFENLPLFSWLLQRGRCRGCDQPIAAQYPLVEASTGLAFVLVYHLLFLVDAHTSIDEPAFPLDAGLLLAWLLLVAVLVASSAMDIVAYIVDVRVVDLATLGGVLCLAGWGRSEVTQSLDPAWAAGATVALLVCAVRLYAFTGPVPEAEPLEEEGDDTAERPASFGPGVLLLLLTLITVSVLCLLPDAIPAVEGTSGTAWAAVAILLVVIIAAVSPPRAADAEIHELIEEESDGARGMVLGELLWLTPALLAGAAAAALVTYVPFAAGAWQAGLGWQIGSVAPLAGATYAMYGAVVGAAAGWFVRIGFTLAFGREAFGTGDIYLLAAAGACAGWDITLLGFLYAVGVALLLWLALLVSKPAAMIAFVPPLSVGFLVALVAHRPSMRVAAGYADQVGEAWSRDPRMVTMAAAFLVFATVISVVVARLLRRVVAPDERA